MSEKRCSQIDYDAIKNQYTITIGNLGKKFAENEYISLINLLKEKYDEDWEKYSETEKDCVIKIVLEQSKM
jgi:hypothetical protein